MNYQSWSLIRVYVIIFIFLCITVESAPSSTVATTNITATTDYDTMIPNTTTTISTNNETANTNVQSSTVRDTIKSTSTPSTVKAKPSLPGTAKCTKTSSPDVQSGGFNASSFFFGAVTVFLLVVILYFVKKLLKEERMDHSALNAHRVAYGRHRDSIQLTDLGVPNGPGNAGNPIIIEVKSLPPIQAEDLPSYVKENRANENLKTQFHDLIPNNPTLATIAATGENIKKNRYKNIFPNDATRVVLTSKVTTENTGYINASYINGNDDDISYIAAQGPLIQTIDDFWLMLWQESVEKIVMLTHLTEGENRVKCEKYWPCEGQEVRYDEIKVKCTNEKTFFSYILRTMDVTFNSETRVILQYHFIAWPDKKIPDDSSRLLRFMQEVTPVDEPIKTPVVVHCSAGIGRTGVYIAIDRQLRLLLKGESINIFNCCQDMRSSRPWMVQTVEQYLFIYECVLEWTFSNDTFIATSDYVKKANMSDVTERRQKEFSALEFVVPTVDELRQNQGQLEINAEKNRCQDILPLDGSRVILQREDADSNYINATFIDGFVKPSEFITTQIPFHHTKQDLWEMVYEYDVTTIILLDDGEQSGEDLPYWPDRTEDFTYGAITIHFEVEEIEEQYVKRTFTIQHEEDAEEIQCVFHYHLTQLPSLHGSLTLLDPLCDLLKITGVGKPESEGITLVQCLDGASMTGVFVASKICTDQIELEQGADIFQAVKGVRKIQPKMVETESQYNLIFRIIERFIERQGGTEEEEVPYENYRKASSTCTE